MQTITKRDIVAALNVMRIVAEVIRTLGEVPNGELYVRLQDRMTFSTYMTIIGKLKSINLIAESNNVLRWIGPTTEETS